MRTAWMFPGQGSLRPGCVRAAEAVADGAGAAEGRAAAAAARTLDAIGEAVGRDLRALGDDRDAGARTADAQPTIFAASLAAAAALHELGAAPDVVAGHSLGECTAAVAAGAWPLDDGARLVAARGEAMGRACAATPGAMAAVVKLAAAAVEELTSRHPEVVVANDNAPGQVVVAGPPDAIAEVRGTARELGGRAVPLEVEGAFHSPAMAPARDELAAALADLRPDAPSVPLLTGTSVTVLDDASAVADALVEGVLAPVRWREVQEALAADGVTHLVEVGPGGVLAGLAKRTVPDLEVVTVATPADAVAVAGLLVPA
ncbi:ACP S-malonyltransferase [Nitriliruptoraceae bacterium ZYF776]|nr:ACP S-malonyltransferase [Profundirhabdus halotolerans]